MKILNVLIIDSDPELASALELIIKRQGDHIVESCHSYRQAMIVRGKFVPDLVFLDINLPDDQSIHFLQTHKARRPDIPIYLMSVINDEPQATEANGFLAKPFEEDVVLDILSYCMGPQVA